MIGYHALAVLIHRFVSFLLVCFVVIRHKDGYSQSIPSGDNLGYPAPTQGDESRKVIGIRDGADSDFDGIPDIIDTCPSVIYEAGFNGCECAPMDLDPANDPQPECKARERVAQVISDPSDAFATRIAFAVVKDGIVHFADAFTYVGQGQFEHDLAGIHRLYRIGSTTKAMTASAAKVLEESGELSLDDFVSDDDATRVLVGGQRTLGQLLSHLGAFKTDYGALHLFCYPNDLAAFWLETNDHISPHYDSAEYGNLGGGYQYSAFNYSLAGAYLGNRIGEAFDDILQTRIFDPAGMCTASLDGARAVNTPKGGEAGVSQAAVMHVGPYINLVSQSDMLCEDNFYSSDDLPPDNYSYQFYRLDEAAAEARDPAGGVIASVVDVAHFARVLMQSYHNADGLISPFGVRQLWEATSDLNCHPNCPYERYYGIGFFTSALPGTSITQVGHGGSRAGYASAFVLRPEDNTAVSILTNADVSTALLSNLAKTILNDLEITANPFDLDLDQDLDLSDFSNFFECMAGPGSAGPMGCPMDSLCRADLDDDGDVDMADYLRIHRQLSE